MLLERRVLVDAATARFVRANGDVNFNKLVSRRRSQAKYCKTLGGSPGLVIMGGDSSSEGRGFGSVYWMGITFVHIYLLQQL